MRLQLVESFPNLATHEIPDLFWAMVMNNPIDGIPSG